MTSHSIRSWFLIHKWTSLICTLFLMMLCVTGLPLIFHDEIDALTESAPRLGMPGVGSSTEAPGLLPLDTILAKALVEKPGEVPVFMAFDNDQPSMTVTTAPAPDAPSGTMSIQLWDRSTGKQVGHVDESGVMHFLLQLHTDMFLGLPGMLFLGAMGVLFLVAIISGVVLYAPFMRKLPFGTVRTARSRRLRWLDYHNLLGITALAWTIVVGTTGVINTLATPIMQLWQRTELAQMTREYAGKGAVPPSRYGSIDKAMAEARKALPGNNPQFIAFPGGSYSSKHHYAVFFQGDTPLTQRLLTPALIDAETGAFVASRPMPWYNKALSLSQPLHFGDYGGLPLKILWALLTLFTMIVLGSGIYLWLGKRRTSTDAHVREVETGGLAVPAE
ncbi:Peptidase [Sphingobium herbicidovorans NBRC 16415]|uniref:Peptidase n=1 Tax=Sphingobium herbicidovorans (strain ATCC 700291 / DSM 11019 / CCUG 56400 / KCTC 2939 / LMG 18315 / NBRC 16415 / MH) TaxID=1219045 RepID=A0A086PE60_SPHHM|nr:PepSY-associated TM helix domain-containing protein [Sphingobium herbicidovorans]KFG91678.1 Peptidase [Sphingobium herbicidovorans NBRC 16415]